LRIGAVLLALLSMWAMVTALSYMNILVTSGTVDSIEEQ
jgi:hypothetical protein